MNPKGRMHTWASRLFHGRLEVSPTEGIGSLLASLLYTGAIRVATEADVDGTRMLCLVSTLQLDGDWVIEIHQRVIDRRDLFGLHRRQVTRQMQSLRRLHTLLAALPWAATSLMGAVGFYTAPGEWLTISGYALGGLVAMTVLRGMAGRIISGVIRLFGRLIANAFRPGVDATS